MLGDDERRVCTCFMRYCVNFSHGVFIVTSRHRVVRGEESSLAGQRTQLKPVEPPCQTACSVHAGSLLLCPTGRGAGKRRCREHKQSASVWHRTVECLHAGRLAPTSTHGTVHNGGHCVRFTAGSAFSSVAMNNTAALRDFSLPLFLEFSQEGLDMSKGSKNLRE